MSTAHEPLITLWKRLRTLSQRRKLEQDLEQELSFHIAMRAEKNLEEGMNAPEAVREARRRFGNVTWFRESCRELWGFGSLEVLWRDIQYGCRMLRHSPTFTAVAVLSLAVGIGGNAAMFSLVDSLLIRPLPYSAPDRLVRITSIFPRAALPEFQQQSRTMDVAAVSTGAEYNLTGQGEAQRIFGSAGSPNFLSVLGARLALGRGFAGGEDLPGRDRVVILSNSLWRNKFGSDPAILGRRTTLDGVDREIIGVMPPGFSFPSSRVQLWVPLRLDPSNFMEYWGGEFVPLIARLRPGATIGQARGETQALVERFRKLFPYPMSREWARDATAVPLQQDLVGDIRAKLIILLASVGVVLLIACANVASLLLSRATTRRKEMALRAALGAGRLRIVRQLLTESVLLGLLGGGLGILFGISALSVFKSVLPSLTPGLAQAAIDWRIAEAVAALALFTGLAFGLAPALSASHIDLAEAVKTGSQRSATSAWTRLRSWLIGAEVALTVVLVVSAGLLIRSLYILSEAQPGFRPEHILTVRISPNQSSCMQRSACVALYDLILTRARGISGIADAAIANTVPLDGEQPTIAVDVEGHPKSADYPAPMLWAGAVSPGYRRMLQIPLLAGRDLTEADAEKSAGVLLISASTARHFWPGEDPIGKHIKPSGEELWRTVVGVVGDVRQYSLSKDRPDWVVGALYMPYAQSSRGDGRIPAAMTLLVKARTDSESLAGEIRSLAQDQDPNLPVGQVLPLDEVVSGSISDFRATIRVFISFAGAALLLAAIGIYGLVSYWVAQRTYEIGVRVAMGATRHRILSMILGQGLRVTVCGIAAGVVAAIGMTRFLASLLYGISAEDPLTFGAVISLVLGIATLATAFPALRACRIDPVKSLRAE